MHRYVSLLHQFLLQLPTKKQYYLLASMYRINFLIIEVLPYPLSEILFHGTLCASKNSIHWIPVHFYAGRLRNTVQLLISKSWCQYFFITTDMQISFDSRIVSI